MVFCLLVLITTNASVWLCLLVCWLGKKIALRFVVVFLMLIMTSFSAVSHTHVRAP